MLLRDSVHGDIYFGQRERRIIDTPALQRLRGIKQLGTGYLVYPGATHTRFEHSLGVCSVAKRIMAELRLKGALKNDLFEERERFVSVLSLVHDVTHIPFGHTFEDELHIFDRHDKRARFEAFLSTGELGSLLSKWNIKNDMIDHLSSTKPGELDLPWITEITTYTICADILDYLRRDAYYCGLGKNYDDRVYRCFTLYDDDQGKKRFLLNMTKHGMLRSDIKSEIVHLLKVRYILTERVYLHHAKVSSGAMISKALNLARKDHGMEKEDLYDLADAGLFQALDDIGDPHISGIISGLRHRHLLKRAYVLSPRTLEVGGKEWERLVTGYHRDPDRRGKLEEEIASTLGVESSKVCVYCMDRPKLKEARVNALTPDGIVSLDQMEDMEELDTIKKQYDNLWRFYLFVPPEVREKAALLAQDIIGYKNEFE